MNILKALHSSIHDIALKENASALTDRAVADWVMRTVEDEAVKTDSFFVDCAERQYRKTLMILNPRDRWADRYWEMENTVEQSGLTLDDTEIGSELIVVDLTCVPEEYWDTGMTQEGILSLFMTIFSCMRVGDADIIENELGVGKGKTAKLARQIVHSIKSGLATSDGAENSPAIAQISECLGASL